MKRLLVLVAGSSNLPFIKVAKQTGYYVITCDYNKKNPGHSYADEKLYIDVYDYKAIIEAIKDKQIDRVFSFVSAHGLYSAAKISEYFDLPGYAPKNLEILTDKGLFRNFLQKENLDCPNFQVVENVEQLQLQNLVYPIILKPVDGGGSLGVIKVNNQKELFANFSISRESSKSGEVIVEKFIDSSKLINGDCLVHHGKLVGELIGDYNYDHSLNEVLPIATIFPSQWNYDRALSQINKIIQLLDIPDGIINFEAILTNDKAYIIEINPRPSGNYIWKLLGYKYNINIPEIILNPSSLSDQPLVGNKRNYAYHLLYTDKEKLFQGFEIPEKLKEGIKDLVFFKNQGEKIYKLSNLYNRVGVVLLESESTKIMSTYINSPNTYKI